MSVPYTTPELHLTGFNCPLCSAFAEQKWYSMNLGMTASHAAYRVLEQWQVAICSRCRDGSFWRASDLIYPARTGAPLAHEDMPESIKVDFEEARTLLGLSPRSAAALLRLCIQKLCKELGESGNDINSDIGNLVKKGLPVKVQQALDIVRVVGNEQVNPGTLDVRDDPAIAVELFSLVNFIVDDLISRPKRLEELYRRLPVNKLEGIVNRDKRSGN